MTTSQRAQLILDQLKNLAAMPEEARQAGSDGIRHLLWVSLESGDEASLQDIRQDMTRHERQIYQALLNEATFEPIVLNGDRKVYSQLIAFPVIIERRGPGHDFPVEIKNERPFVEAIYKSQVGGNSRGISMQRNLYSYSELMTIPHSQLYRTAVDSVRTAWNPGAIPAIDCKEAAHDPYTVHVNEDDHVLALRFIVATSFTYSKKEFRFPDEKLSDMGNLLAFLVEESMLARTTIKICKPGRIDHAILGAIPEFYGQTTRSLLALDDNTQTTLQVEADGSGGVLAVMPEAGFPHYGIPLFLPSQEEDVTQAVVDQVAKASKDVTGNDMTLTIGGQRAGGLH